MTDASSNLLILHEDSRIITVNKPAGQAVIPGRSIDPETVLVRAVERHCGSKIFVVHRLDKETSGVILFARDAAAHRFLSMQFEHRKIEKHYLALAMGIISEDGTIDKPIRQFGSGRMGVADKGQESKTGYHVLQRCGSGTVLDVRPFTGRRHQIRVHLYAIGHPVMGDPLYGQDRPVGGAKRLMLHAQSIAFQHPSGEAMIMSAEPGTDWQNEIRRISGCLSRDS
jgi:RluA family pseudouridine synthase